LASTIESETDFIGRLQAAADLDAAAEALDDERLDLDEPADGLWGLDIGVASAVAAFSALGGAPVSSCNAGGFGGTHTAEHPYVAGYLPAAAADVLLEAAEAAGVGIATAADG